MTVRAKMQNGMFHDAVLHLFDDTDILIVSCAAGLKLNAYHWIINVKSLKRLLVSRYININTFE